MKVRIKFAKSGIARFIGHLDVMRYFQKAVRRAGIAIRYSGGFSPHQLMSFAAPLGVGITSNGEYLDIEVEDDEEAATMKERLNQVMAEGFSVKSCLVLPKEAGNAMSLVAAARYTIAFRPGYMPQNPEEWFAGLVSFYDREQVNIIKKTKKGEKELDLKPLIYELKSYTLKPCEPESKSYAPESSPCAGQPALSMLISTGSTENIKPELVLDAYYQYLKQERPAFAFFVQREEVYAKKDPKKEGNFHADDFLPLEAFGRKEGCLE